MIDGFTQYTNLSLYDHIVSGSVICGHCSHFQLHTFVTNLMSKLTLGYESDQQIPKSEIARIQLVEAITLFFEGNFICSITLAGAAEGVYAGILEDEGTASVVEESAAAIQRIRESSTLDPFEGKPQNQIYSAWNAARNDLKHHGKGKSAIVTINLFDESFWMIKRALANAQKLGASISNAHDFENWVVANINL